MSYAQIISTFRRDTVFLLWCMLLFGGDIMDQYVTGAVIKELREKKNMTQAELAEKLLISD